MNTKTDWLRVRLTPQEKEKLLAWSIAYGEDTSTFVRRMLQSLPDEPPVIQPPPIKV
jgi:hypothetical protein